MTSSDGMFYVISLQGFPLLRHFLPVGRKCRFLCINCRQRFSLSAKERYFFNVHELDVYSERASHHQFVSLQQPPMF